MVRWFGEYAPPQPDARLESTRLFSSAPSAHPPQPMRNLQLEPSAAPTWHTLSHAPLPANLASRPPAGNTTAPLPLWGPSSSIGATAGSAERAKRIRASLACDQCKRHKTKCDGQGSACSRCSKRKSECTYLVPKRTRGPGRRRAEATRPDSLLTNERHSHELSTRECSEEVLDTAQHEDAGQHLPKRQRLELPPHEGIASASSYLPSVASRTDDCQGSREASGYALEPPRRSDASLETVVVKTEPVERWITIEAEHAEPPSTPPQHISSRGEANSLLSLVEDTAGAWRARTPMTAGSATDFSAVASSSNSRIDANSRSGSITSSHSVDMAPLKIVATAITAPRGIHFPHFDPAYLGRGKRWPADCELALARYVTENEPLRRWAMQWKGDGWTDNDTDGKLLASLQRFSDLTQGPPPESVYQKLLSCRDQYLRLIAGLTVAARSTVVSQWSASEDLQWLTELQAQDSSRWLEVWHHMRVSACVTASASVAANVPQATAFAVPEPSEAHASVPELGSISAADNSGTSSTELPSSQGSNACAPPDNQQNVETEPTTARTDTSAAQSEIHAGNVESMRAFVVKLEARLRLHERHIMLLHSRNEEQRKVMHQQAEMLKRQAQHIVLSNTQLAHQTETLNDVKQQLESLRMEMKERR